MAIKINRILLFVFSAFWVVFILLDYWNKHPNHNFAFNNYNFQVLSLYHILLSLGFASFIWFCKTKLKSNKLLNGLSLILLGFIGLNISFFEYARVAEFEMEFDFSNILLLHRNIILYLLLSFGVLTFTIFYGKLFLKYINFVPKETNKSIIELSLGLMLVTLICFILAAFGVFNVYLALPLLIAPMCILYKDLLQYLANILIRPIKLFKELNFLGSIAFYFMFLMMSLNFVHILTPMPIGFDSMSLYVNLPKLISDRASLQTGFQPYNWSLFMSLGFVLVGKTQLTLILSSFGGLFSTYAIYRLVVDFLKFDKNHAILLCLCFYITPIIFHQSSKELKVDLGLLFYLLSILWCFILWLKEKNFLSKEDQDNVPSNTIDGLLVFIAILIGFAMGIKLTTLFIVIAVLASIWFSYFGLKGFISFSVLSIGVLLILKIDEMSGMRVYNLSVDYFQWFLFLSGGIALVVFGLKKRSAFFKLIKINLLFLVFIFLPFMPWLTKNAIETKSLSIYSLLNGKKNTPKVNIKKVMRTYKKELEE